MVETYKVTHGLYKIDQEQLLPKKRYTGNRGHSQQLEKFRVTTTLRQKTFTHCVVSTWNSLLEEVVNAPSVNSWSAW
jgi:hypothetical protein